MYLYIRRLVLFLSLLVLCSCSTAALPTFDKGIPNNTEATTQLSVTQSSPLSVSDEATDNSTEVTRPSPTPNLPPIMVDLRCTNYTETQWGTEPEEFGLCPTSSEVWIRGPYSPKLNAQGDLFIVDKVNQRILRYSSGHSTPQVISIPSSYVLNDVCYSNRGWSNVSVSKDRLFFVFPVLQDGRIEDQLAVLSLEGQEERIINLEAYYPLHSPYLDSLISDRNGGVYLLLPPAGIVHFDANLRPEFKYLGGDDILIYENLVVGWDGNLYTYSIEHDSLTNWGSDNRAFMLNEPLDMQADVIAATQIVSPTYTRLLGADTQGRFYFKTRERGGNVWVARVSASGDERVVAAMPEGEPLPSSLAPDGSLYGVAYDPLDPSVKPRIIKCVFDAE